VGQWPTLYRSGKGREEGGRLGATWGQERSGEGGARVWHRVSRHGMGAEALGHSDSGGRHTSRGHGRHARIGEATGARNTGASADKWSATTRGLVGRG
jgi:hypothetical protein